MCRRVLPALLILSCLAAVPAFGDEGRIPVWMPTTLTGPGIDGQYIVTRNIFQTVGGGVVIDIIGGGFDEVELDLNGFTLFGDPAGGAHIIKATGLRSLTIRNGALRPQGPPPGDGVHVEGTVKVILEDLLIEDVGAGIYLADVPNYTVRSNIIVMPDSTGIQIQNAAAAGFHTGIVADNQIRGANQDGIDIIDPSSGTVVRDNRLHGIGGLGIHLFGANTCLVVQNTVEEAQAGILLEQVKSCKLVNNVTSSNTVDGIAALGVDNTLFLDNVANGNGLNGLLVDGTRNKVEGSLLNDNACFGLWLAGRDNTFGRNTARGNLGSGATCPAASCTVPPVEVCPAPWGGGSAAPDLCVSAIGNTSQCDNLMPGPPPS